MTKLILAAAALMTLAGTAAAAHPNDHRRGYDHRGYGNHHRHHPHCTYRWEHHRKVRVCR